MENKEKLAQVIEGILFVSGEAVSITDIMSKLEITEQELNEAVETLEFKYNNPSGIILKQFNRKLQLATNPEYIENISLVLNPIRERALSKATIETLAIICYKQPITRLEIEEIRGVSCDYAVSVLMEHKLIEIVGKKDVVGKPVMFGTTDNFLKRFNLNSLEDLPDKESLLARIKTIRDSDRDQSLYRQFDISDEEIIPEKIREKQESKLLKIESEIEIPNAISGEMVKSEFGDADDFV
jgi:segregation and condensation protein B